MYRQLLQSHGPDAQALLNTFQKLIDAGRLAEDRKNLILATERLSRARNLYPLGFKIEGIKRLRDVPDADGEYADIYQGEYKGILVCLKWIRIYGPQRTDYLQRSREIILWRQLSHPNILPFLGLSRAEDKLFLVSPWVQNGHINGYLKQNTTANRPLLYLDVAAGLRYLHQNDIIHGDLKGVNILVDDSGRACIAGFSLTSVIDQAFDPLEDSRRTSYSLNSWGRTMNWQAPELFDVEVSGLPKHTKASDVYAWACVCYEIFTGEHPFFEYPINSQISEMVLSGKRPSRPALSMASWTQWGLTEDIWMLMSECWLHDPMDRPNIDNIVRRLEGHIMQTDTRPSASWGRIVLTRPKDEVSFPRASEIINGIIPDHPDAPSIPLISRTNSRIRGLRMDENFAMLNQNRNPLRNLRPRFNYVVRHEPWYQKWSLVIGLVSICIAFVVFIIFRYIDTGHI